MPSKACVECGKFRPIFNRQMCAGCFFAWGTANGVADVDMPQKCSADDCSAFASKKGMCDIHYRRFVDHGHTNRVRREGKSEIRQHEYFKNWEYLKRNGLLEDVWHDFSVFIADVGDRPSKNHRAYKPNQDAVYGPGNFEWRPTRNSEDFDVARLERKKHDPEQAVLKRYYGITQAEYDALLKKQNGTCAVCDSTGDNSVKGGQQALSVDHDHKTGEIRGLLCRKHNFAIGQIDDDPKVAERILWYLVCREPTGLSVRENTEYHPRGRPGVRGKAKGLVCSVDGCESPVKSKMLCSTHYAFFKRTGTTEKQTRMRDVCQEPGCTDFVAARGLCKNHYNKNYQARRVEQNRLNRESLKSLHSSSLTCDNPVSLRGDSVPSDVPPIGV